MIIDARQIVCAYSRKPQNMSLIHADTCGSLENRREFLKNLGIDYRDIVCAKQTHSDHIRLVKEGDKGKGALDQNTAFEDTDALVTNIMGIPLCIYTADCLPVFLFDPQGKSVGIVHAGWEGTKKGISAKTVTFMRGNLNTRPEGLMAGFGPAIRGCCKKEDLLDLDIADMNRQQLLESGVKPENIFDSNICTSCCNQDYFCFRLEKEASGRMISVIILVRP